MESFTVKQCLRLFLPILLLPVVVWSGLVFWFMVPDRGLIYHLVLVGCLVLALFGVIQSSRHRRLWALPALVGWAGALLLWAQESPLSDRDDWSPEVSRVVQWNQNGETLQLHNVRDFHYHSADSFEPRWIEETLNLNTLNRLDLAVAQISRNGWIGHVFLTFGFQDGRQIAASVEIRRQEGESYDPLRGCFRAYELVYVIGTERDILGLRLNHRKNPVRLYPVQADPLAIQQLFVEILTRAITLQAQPEFYHTLSNNCTTNLVAHVDALLEKPLITGWRRSLPETAAEQVFHSGYFAMKADNWAQARADALLTPLDAPTLTAVEWSRRLRSQTH